jgi:hypothetical protein
MRTGVSYNRISNSSFDCGAKPTKINVLRLDFSVRPDFVLPTEAADDVPIRDATRARVTNISAQRECVL